MEDHACLTLIQNSFPRLTDVEKKVAAYLLANGEKVVYMTVSELAEATGVAPSGIIRFCKKVGYAGYSDLKISLARSVVPGENRLLPAVDGNDSDADVLNKVFASSIDALHDTLMLLDRAAFTQAVNLLQQAKRIVFFGIGTSSTIAADAFYRIMRIGYPAFYAVDPQIMRTLAAALSPGSVAVGISHSGETYDTVKAVRIAREQGANTLVITSYQDSPICRYADLALTAFSDEIRYPIEAVSSRIAHVALLDALCVALSLREPKRTSRHMALGSKYLEDFRVKAAPSSSAKGGPGGRK